MPVEEYIAYNNTDVKQIETLYQKLLDEKERTIVLLQEQLKN